MSVELAFDAELWQHGGAGGWHFVTVPLAVADDIRELAPEGRGFGSRRVTASIGVSTWSTSVFPDSGSGSFVLPVKQQVRRDNDLVAGDVVRVVLHVDVSGGAPASRG